MRGAPVIAWHYTAGRTLPAILRSGVLLPGDAAIEGERPGVWFSTRGDWEPAVGLGARLPREVVERAAAVWIEHGPAAGLAALPRGGTIADLGGLARIGVAPEAAPFTWADFARAGGLDPLTAWARLEVDRARGSDPADWRLSFVPVPASSWLAVEWRSGVPGRRDRWEPIEQ